jgi:FkbM family methyltransferase
MSPNISIKNIAISDKNGKIPFFLTNTKDLLGKCNDNGIGASSLKTPITNIAGLPTTGFKKILVDSVTGDAFCKKNKIKPDVLILDVQGSEIDVLRSFKKNLKNIDYLFVEFPVNKEIMYIGDASALSVIYELKKKGFFMVMCYNISSLSADGIFLNINSFSKKKLISILFIKVKAITQIIKFLLISRAKKTVKLILNTTL